MNNEDNCDNEGSNQEPLFLDSAEQDWAIFLSKIMTPEKFSLFTEFLDGCDDVEFSERCKEIDAKRFPEKFVNPDDCKKIPMFPPGSMNGPIESADEFFGEEDGASPDFPEESFQKYLHQSYKEPSES